jgi:Ca2+-binding RTX toxin-like protein
MRRKAATPVALVAAIALALLSAGAVLAHQPFPGQATDGNDTVTGTSADETWVGSPGNDTIRGQGGSDIIGEDPNTGWDFGATSDPGADTYYGGPGTDILEGRERQDFSLIPAAVDTLDCGDGVEDLASFDKGSATYPPTTVTDKVNTSTCERLDWTDASLPDCAEKPWDNADVICKTGTNGPDTLIGRDVIDARIVDMMWGQGGNDTLRGRRGFDGLEGGAGQDTLYGGWSPDVLYGNWYSGNKPPDVPYEAKPDRVYGEAGDDRIDVSDPRGFKDPLPDYAKMPDTVSCGDGTHDWAVIDIGIDKTPQGVPITRPGQAGCESISEDQSFKRWWGPRRR